MANPTVDKLKAFGLLHGEKVAMGATAVVFAVCTYFAWSHPSIDVTAEQVQETAKKANANLQRQQSEEGPNGIIAQLDTLGVKLQDFEKKVDVIQSGTIDASKYQLARPFVTPEPGAGLIRDTPVFLAPEQLYVHANRGAARVLVVDEEGEFVVADPKEPKVEKKKKKSRATSRGGMGGGMGGMGRMGGSTKKKKKATGALAEAQKKKDEDEEEKRKEKMLAGGVDAMKKDDDKPDEKNKPDVTAENVETELQGFRFVNIVGVFDHSKQKEAYAKALKEDAASAAPDYLRLEVERQEKQGNNTWGPWTKVDHEKVVEITGLLKKAEDEIVPAESRISTLIDSIPFLEIGDLYGAHPASLVPRPKPTPKATTTANGLPGGVGSQSTKMGGGNQFSAGDYEKMGKGPGSVPGGGDYAANMRKGMNMDFGQNDAKAPSRGPSGGDYEKSNAEQIMIRALDYEVEPDSVYHYRVRIVFANPNHNWESVAPGVDNKSKEIPGPWSPITPEVHMPPDVATYAQGKTPAAANAHGDQFEFSVVAWNEDDGITVVHKFDQAPGQIIGGIYSLPLPDPKKGGMKSRPIDFTSHQILADASGGERPTAEIQPLGSNRLEVPVVALVVRADGLLVLRDEAKDATSGELAEKKAIFDRYMKVEGAPKKEPAAGGGLLGAPTGKGAAGNN